MAGMAGRLLLGAVLGVLAFEAGLRLIQATPLWRALPVVPPILGLPDRETGFVFRPGASGIWMSENRAPVSINAMGLRDSEIDPHKPAGVFRVLLTGDSYIEALQVDQRHSMEALSEERLAGLGHRIEIANLAMSGHGPLRQLARLRQMAPRLDGDLVVSFLRVSDFATSELSDDSKFPAYVEDSSGALVEGHAFQNRFMVRNADNPLVRLSLWVITNSEVARILYWLHREPPIGGTARSGQEASGGNSPACDPDYWRTLDELWRHHRPEGQWRRAARFAKDYSDWLAAGKLPAIVVLRLAPVPSAPGCTGARLERTRIMGEARQLFADRGVATADIEEMVEREVGKADPRPVLHFGGEGRGHYNHTGHAYFARALTTIILRHLTGQDAQKSAHFRGKTPVLPALSEVRGKAHPVDRAAGWR
ncbi:MAG: hypothetical protein AB7G34_12700 [Hyphomicrobiales bacterium]